MDDQAPLSFVIMLDLTQQAHCVWLTDSVSALLGWTTQNLLSKSFFDLVHPDEVEAARKLHYDHVKEDYAATLTYLRLKHKSVDSGSEEWPLCAFARSVAYNLIVGTISLATPDPGNTRAATASGGVFVLTPSARDFSFCRYNSKTNSTDNPIFTGSSGERTTPLKDLPRPSKRVAMLVDRFKQRGVFVFHTSNDCIVPNELIFTKDLLQFIPEETDRVALDKSIHLVKTWGTLLDTTGGGIFTSCNFTLQTPTNPPQLKKLHAFVTASSDAVLLTLLTV